jgi:transglutaminase-like putative cysteine protease
MASRVSYRKEDRFLFPPCSFKRFIPPGEPIHRVVGMLLQIGAALVNETVHIQMVNHMSDGFTPELDITVRVGCEIHYETRYLTPAYMVLRPRRSSTQRIVQEMLSFEPGLNSTEDLDTHGSILDRVMLKPGLNIIRHDAMVAVRSTPERIPYLEIGVPPDQIPGALLRYTLPSRYCDSDKLMAFAAERFGGYPSGGPTVRAICDWLNKNIEYRTCSGSPDLSAADVIARGYGVCRDFAHTAIALSRTFNIPARYVTGHLPDIGCIDPGAPMDFHAYFEVFLEHQWITMDSRFNVPRIGRVKIACGMDAVDGAFSTIYGEATLKYFEVWAYQVNPAEVSIGDPIDLAKRLDGTIMVRRA